MEYPKMRRRMRSSIFIALIASAAISFAEDQNGTESGRIELPAGLVLKPHAYGHFEAGQIESGSMNASAANALGFPQGSYTIDHVWTENADIEFGFDAFYRERLKLAFSLGSKLYFSYPVVLLQRYTKNMRQDIYFDEVNVSYHFGDASRPLLMGEAGYFKFKYNPDVRNLGEYLFRTGTYPIWFDMGFDSPQARLLGLHAQSNLFESLRLDLLFVSGMVHPAMDWSLSGLANYDIGGIHFVNIGAGVDFANLLSVYGKKSVPMFGGDPTTPQNSNVNYQYITDSGDTAWYTFKGTKIMGRIGIDPKVLIPWRRFGENDLRIYTEADIIGIKSYPDSGITPGGLQWVAPSYDKLLEKMPVAIGINLPAFKALDVLNAEMEWFGAKYYNDASGMMNMGSAPLPWDVSSLSDPNAKKKNQYKWSVYAKRSFLHGHFALTGQVGRDHMRLPCASYNDEMWNELLVEAKDWWWIVKTSWMF